VIPDELLERYQARTVELEKGEILFDQGDSATHFFIVRSGRIKMSSYNDEGRELVKGYFTEAQSFGEPPFFNHLPYPAAAIAVEPSSVWKIPYEAFMRLLRENFEIHLQLTQVLSGRLIYKSMMLTEIAVEEAEHRLTTLIEYFRDSDEEYDGGPWRVPFTRQQLADMTGLRVETVIRTVKGMESKGMLGIEDGKILWNSDNSANQYSGDF
jgi:CRP-like cAMP-binding protein